MTESDHCSLTGVLERLAARQESVDPEQARRVVEALHGLARRHMERQQPGHTLQPTALVHEAYLKLFVADAKGWRDRKHFYKVASAAMRAILVDHARGKAAKKRDPGGDRLDFATLVGDFEVRARGLSALDESLARLEKIDPRAVRIVELRFFAGQTIESIAEILGISVRTVARDLKVARAWLHREMSP